MAKVPPAYRRVLAEHRRRLSRIADQQGIRTLKRAYEGAIRDIERRLVAIPGAKRDRFTAHQYRLFLGQMRQGLRLITERMVGTLGDITREAQREALRGLIYDVSRLEKHFTGAEVVLPVEEAARFQGVISGVRESLLREQQVSWARYGARLILKMEDQLSRSLLVGDDLGSAIDRITVLAGSEWWQAERIARTEILWSYNATHRSGIQESAKLLPDMMMRWSEHISDSTWRALDDRVDGGHGRVEDSHAMHGQVAAPGDVFRFPDTMADGSPVPGKLWRFRGETWPHPPNRPNDRASLAPWRPHWGVPAWHVVGGARVWL